MASYYVNVLWLNIVTLVAVAVARVMIVAVLGRTSSLRYFMGAARTNAKKILCGLDVRLRSNLDKLRRL